MKVVRIVCYTMGILILASLYCVLPLALAMRSLVHPTIVVCLGIAGGVLLGGIVLVCVILRKVTPKLSVMQSEVVVPDYVEEEEPSLVLVARG